MASRADFAGVGAPRYRAELPWLGPIQGGIARDRDARVRIGGASDPVLGEALAAVLLPVVRDGDGKHFEPPTKNGEPGKIVDIGWAFALDNDRNGRFRIEAPPVLWAGGVDGVLMVLLYDRSGIFPEKEGDPSGDRRFPGDWAEQLEVLHVKSASAEARREGPIHDLPEPMQIEIERRVHELLGRSLEKLEPGLIEFDLRLANVESDAQGVTFAVASCQYPAGLLDRDVAERSYAELVKCLQSQDREVKPDCMLLLGDQIYADATAGLFDPSTLYDRFELPHEQLLRMAPLRTILRRLPVYTMLDDHEIEDNWEPIAGDPDSLRIMRTGRGYYLDYQRMAGPKPIRVRGDSSVPLWTAFDVNGLPFFIADTRTERDARTAQSVQDASIMHDEQFGALLDWLARYRESDVPKFIASPACFLPRRLRATQKSHPASALRSDSWDGYPQSLHRLLATIVANQIGNVIFLSGDEHISFLAHAQIQARATDHQKIRIASLHSSALYAPFPFANATPDDLAWEETFSFRWPTARAGEGQRVVAEGGDCVCEVSTQFAPPGDGFTLLRIERSDGRWRVRCRFVRGPSSAATEEWLDVL